MTTDEAPTSGVHAGGPQHHQGRKNRPWWRWAVAAACVVAPMFANEWLESYTWSRMAIGGVLGLALATEVVLPRGRRGWGIDADTFWQHLNTEIHRARRHDRSLLLVRWTPTDQNEPRVLDDVSSQLRSHDAVCFIGSHRYLLLAEVDASHTRAVLDRLGVPIDELSRTMIAEYPTDGLSVDGLIEGLRAIPADADTSVLRAS